MREKNSNQINSEKKRYRKNLLNVFIGSTSGYIIAVAALPILTRLYSVEVFGTYGIYLAALTIAKVVYCLRYDFLIQAGKDHEESRNIFWLCVYLGLASTLLLLFLFITVVPILSISVNTPKWLYFLPLFFLISVVDQLISHWSNKIGKHKLYSLSRFLRSVSIVFFQLLLFRYFSESGLILGAVAGELLITMFIWLTLIRSKNHPKTVNLRSLKGIFLEHKNQPIFILPGHTINALVAQTPLVAISTFFGLESAGLYSLAQRIVSVPGQLISGSISKVFYTRANRDFTEMGNCQQITKETLGLVIPLIIISMFFIALLGSTATTVIFGNEWSGAVKFIIILSIAEITPAIFLSISPIWLITRNQKLNFKFQLLRTLIIYTAIILGLATGSEFLFLIIFGASRFLSFAIFLQRCIYLSVGK